MVLKEAHEYVVSHVLNTVKLALAAASLSDLGYRYSTPRGVQTDTGTVQYLVSADYPYFCERLCGFGFVRVVGV